LGSLAVLATVIPTAALAAPPEVTDLGTLGGGNSWAFAVSENREVVGGAETATGDEHAFSWTPAGGMVDLGTLGGSESLAFGVNDNGEVVGCSDITGTGGSCSAGESGNDVHAFSWTATGGMVDLGTLGGATSDANAVNDSGQVVGWAETASGAVHAFSWTRTGGMVDLGTLGGLYSNAAGVSDSGQVVGTAATANGDLHAFSWTPGGGMVDLGTLGGSQSLSFGVNDSGEVVGCADIAGGAPYQDCEGGGSSEYAFDWTTSGGMVDLGALGGSASVAYGVNDNGEVVGEAQLASGPSHAFSWTQAGGMVDLETLGGLYSAAYAVNDNGQIVGSAEKPEDKTAHAVIWFLNSGASGTSGGGGGGTAGLSGCVGSPLGTWTGDPLVAHSSASLPAPVPVDSEVEVADELQPSATGSCSLLPPGIDADLPVSLDIHNGAGTVSLGLFSHDVSGAPAMESSEPFNYAPPSARDLHDAIHPSGGWYVIPLGTETSNSTISFTDIEPLEFAATLEDLLAGYLKLNEIQLQAAIAVAAGAVVFVAFDAIAEVAATVIAGLGIDEGAGAVLAALRSIFPALQPAPALGGLATVIPAAVLGPAGSVWSRLTGLAAATRVQTAATASPVEGPVAHVAHVEGLRARDLLKGLRAQPLSGATASAVRESVLTLPVPSVIRPLVASRRLPRGGQAVTILGGHLPGTQG
jgi:probable HAF family extracellular repeat protein